ncbi:23S rRNA (pseudouridine(1915)-N(3))-methyltransferase RlmH [Candidatus Aminicenantes bacterium AC-708-M15]|jgi:23S rRNA (pseudouridine1915-N3)-methyltransferase|nr:23S rRNA (pseudouridine(1915)-N(3))-methyltransferase RlmH [SCandidatus Aminicenantes bacterium Aminicenantia_JdfR_composite]MCP2596814.1 23S rRNA (pseudouridine(1915)-N(3))-methyltransferase RlmH [Candidatus Aminicenantes bacterium AC-335-G13]MCP2598275.1 23S rRNA (pseudouridine(1915)-N(3))-methyltransferase RlmH [Candidatus Aminicenantes bacterium AC-335-L06]MCP2604014.1 23S rRNA (pseudouridine(1915)-N(3))-methyltransferase RlmH [Candidatus Aminicenantes bacterium AC-708-M15]MCP2606499.1 2
MKIRIIWPGKTKNKILKSLEENYLKKINQFIPCQIIETKEAKGIKEKFIKKIREKECKALENYLEDNYIICLTEKGKEMSSMEFAKFLEKLSISSPKDLVFVVGGYAGLDEKIIKRANFLLSLSKMTFTHELSRVILLEQIYRAFSIIRGRKYAK